ncbi:hypothetical protein GCM10010399_92580 [Dactylosporangium fulvum]
MLICQWSSPGRTADIVHGAIGLAAEGLFAGVGPEAPVLGEAFRSVRPPVQYRKGDHSNDPEQPG